MDTTQATKVSKIIAGLISLAFLMTVLYVAAFFRVEKTHAADPLFYSNVEIQDGSMKPLAVNIAAPSVNAGVTADLNTRVDTSASASPTPQASSAVEAKTDSSVSVNIPVDMSSSNDLKLYTKTLEENDRKISSVETSDDHILVSYQEPAKFLGFIPVSVTAHAKVDAQGKVKLSYPWYTFLSTKNDAALRTNLQTKVDVAMKGAAFGNLGVRDRAEVVQALHLALRDNK